MLPDELCSLRRLRTLLARGNHLQALPARLGALAALETLEVNVRQMGSGDGLTAFDAVRPAVESQPDDASRDLLLEGLFGPRGPALYRRATAVREGIDHTWDLRYEIDMGR